jgi:hypothetical protein
MSFAKLVAACGLAAIALAACGSSSTPEAGSSGASTVPAARGRIDDPRIAHIGCLRSHNIPATLVGQTDIQIGAAGGPLIVFTPTAGDAQGTQITGQSQGAEVIGSALLYPRSAGDAELGPIEACLTQGVKG